MNGESGGLGSDTKDGGSVRGCFWWWCCKRQLISVSQGFHFLGIIFISEFHVFKKNLTKSQNSPSSFSVSTKSETETSAIMVRHSLLSSNALRKLPNLVFLSFARVSQNHKTQKLDV